MNSDTNINYRLVNEQDLPTLAKIYCTLYTKSALHENWDQASAYKLLKFFYDHNSDIFVVAENNGQAIVAIASLVKPWHDGNRLIETEVFVAEKHQHKGIGSNLFEKHFGLAMKKYNTKIIEAHTYEEPDGYPLNWYRKQGYEVIQDWFVINGEIGKVYNYLKHNCKEHQ